LYGSIAARATKAKKKKKREDVLRKADGNIMLELTTRPGRPMKSQKAKRQQQKSKNK
jgi:hypothetical protein